MVNADQAESYLQALLSSVTINVIVPLVILFALIGFSWRLLVLAQRKSDFNIEEMFKDEAGKPSSVRFIMLMAFAISSWYLAVRVLSGKPEPIEYLYYLGTWSGAAVFIKLAERWTGQLPFAKGPDGGG